MNQHYSEADLLETYYTAPGASMPVMMHLAGCTDCAARYERLEAKLRSLASCAHDQPETFWSRQRLAVMRRVNAPSRARMLPRFAAAAALAVVVGATFSWPLQDQQTVPTLAENPSVAVETLVAEDPWESPSLQQYQPLVEWESWVETEEGQS